MNHHSTFWYFRFIKKFSDFCLDKGAIIVKIIKHSDDENLLYYPAESRKYTEDQLEKVRETARNIFCSRKEELTEYTGLASTLYYNDFAEYFKVFIYDDQAMLTPEQHWIDAHTGEILPSAELARRCLGSKYDEIMSDNPDFYERVSQDELTRMFSDIRYDKITGEPYYNFCFFSDHIWNEEENKYVHEDWSFNIPIEL